MLSDEWLKLGYTHGDNIEIVNGLIDYVIWTGNCSAPVGVSVNFEYADDVHYDLHYVDWMRFLKDCLHTEPPEDYSGSLYAFFSVSDCFVFDDVLVKYHIPYDRVAFYNPEDIILK